MDNLGFRDLRVYHNSKELVKMIYGILEMFPKKEQYALSDQLRRACVSVPSNIAEGMSRVSDNEKVHFLEIAYGSLMEVLCQVEISEDLQYISKDQVKMIEELVTVIAKQLSKLRSSIITLNPKL